jgi:NADP-dependent 3-hydroxy acid dehydrogenase YdfG
MEAFCFSQFYKDRSMSIAQDVNDALFGMPDKVAIVTGAGSRIGRATAKLMVQEGGDQWRQ